MFRHPQAQPRGPRDLSQEQRDYQRRTKRNDAILIGVFLIVICVMLPVAYCSAHPSTAACYGNQVVTVQQGDTLESMIRDNVDDINSVDIRDVVDDVAEANRLSDADLGQLQPGSEINHIPFACS